MEHFSQRGHGSLFGKGGKQNEKERKSCDRMQHRCRDLLRDRQLRSFLPWTDGTWMAVCRFDGRTAGAGGDELQHIKEDKLIVIAISPNDKLGGTDE